MLSPLKASEIRVAGQGATQQPEMLWREGRLKVRVVPSGRSSVRDHAKSQEWPGFTGTCRWSEEVR